MKGEKTPKAIYNQGKPVFNKKSNPLWLQIHLMKRDKMLTKEISRRLNISCSNIYSHLNQAKKRGDIPLKHYPKYPTIVRSNKL